MQLEFDVALVVVEYVLIPQLRHAAAVKAPKVAEYLPAPQSVHSKEPVDGLYFPASHAMQSPPSGPVYPALH